jgi:hypothetical protein
LLAFTGSALRRTAYAISLVFMVILTILPWTARNYSVFNRIIPVSTGSGLFLWRGNNELTWGDSDDRHLDPGAGEVWTNRLNELTPDQRDALVQAYTKVRRELASLDSVEYDRYLLKLALAYMSEHPIRALEVFFYKVRTLYTAFTPVRAEHGEFIGRTKRFLFSLLFYPTLLLGALGALYGLRNWRQYLLVYLPIIALTLGYGVLTAAARFRVPVEPYIIIFASYACVVIWDFVKSVRSTYGSRDPIPSGARFRREA